MNERIGKDNPRGDGLKREVVAEKPRRRNEEIDEGTGDD